MNYGNGLLECGTQPIVRGCSASYQGTISPRFGFSWDPFGKGKTAVRGGYALNWDSSNPLHAGGGFNGNAPTTATLGINNVLGFESIQPGPLGTAYFSDVPTTRKWPQVQQFSLGVQHELPGSNLLSVSYVGTIGRHLQQTQNINQVPIGLTTVNVPALAGTPGCDAAGNCNAQSVLINNNAPALFFAPYRGYNTISMRNPSGNSNYNALQASLRHSSGYGMTYEVSYTWSHTLDDIIPGNGVDDSNPRRWYGTSSLSQGRSVANWIYQLPFFKTIPTPLFAASWEAGSSAVLPAS